jgi:hypothetical protein
VCRTGRNTSARNNKKNHVISKKALHVAGPKADRSRKKPPA